MRTSGFASAVDYLAQGAGGQVVPIVNPWCDFPETARFACPAILWNENGKLKYLKPDPLTHSTAFLNLELSLRSRRPTGRG